MESPEEFWQRVEREIGEKPIYHTMARCQSGCEDDRSTTWGLFFISPSAIHFWVFPQESWLSAITTTRRSSKDQSEKHYTIDRSEIESTKELRPSFFARLFGGRRRQLIFFLQSGGSYYFEGLERDFVSKVVSFISPS